MNLQLPFDLGLRRGDGAEDFLVATANADAAAWIDRWPDWPASGLVLYGPAGSGKSHLAQVWRRRSGARAVDMQTLALAPPPELVDSAPALLIDPAGPGVPERALLHVVNLIREQGRALLLVAREPPARWGMALPDLASRIAALPAIAIGVPDDDLLRAVMAKHFHDRQVSVAPEVLDYLLPRMERSLAAAQAIVAQLDRHALAERAAITVALARRVLSGSSEGDGDGFGD